MSDRVGILEIVLDIRALPFSVHLGVLLTTEAPCRCSVLTFPKDDIIRNNHTPQSRRQKIILQILFQSPRLQIMEKKECSIHVPTYYRHIVISNNLQKLLILLKYNSIRLALKTKLLLYV